MRRYLILTYDYELFLGNRSGSVEQCELRPTEKILELHSKFGAKAVFFVDTLHLVALKLLADQGNRKASEDFEKLKLQFADMLKAGHYIYPHIHPHWFDAVYNEASHQWDLSNVSRYRFQQCSEEQKKTAFQKSIGILKEMIHPVMPGYVSDGFRAGGWCIQPFSDFKPYFIENGLRYDMSVLPGFYSFAQTQYFDFTDTPGKVIYRFEDDVCREDASGRFIQLTISSVSYAFTNLLFDWIWLRLSPHLKNNMPPMGSGHLAQMVTPLPISKKPGFNILKNGRQRMAVELLTPLTLSLYKKFLKNHEYLHFLSHPKMISRYQFRLFKKFLDYAYSNFDVETDFKVCLKEQGLL